MRIQNNISNLNFNARLNTASVLETTSLTIFRDDGLNGIKQVVNELKINPKKATGWRGYRYFAQIAGEKICAKYPEIENATKQIKKIKKDNPKMTSSELYDRITPIIAQIGETIDIVL